MVFTIGAIQRSKGRDYGEIAKVGIILGLTLGAILAIIGFFVSTLNDGKPFISLISVFIGSLISIFFSTILGGWIYDLSEWARKA